MPLHLFFRAMIIAALALLAPACGGGGGGGGGGGSSSSASADDGSTEGDDSGAEEPVEEEEEEEESSTPFTRTQNVYMPLSTGTSIEYTDDTTSTNTLDTDEFSGLNVYAIANNGLTLYVSSTEETISLHGIDGSFVIESFTVSKLRFGGSSTSLPIYSSLSTEGDIVDIDSGTINAIATVNAPGLTFPFDIAINIEVTSEYNDVDLTLGYGNLPAREIELAFTIDDEVLTIPITYNFTDTLWLTKGIGITQRAFASDDLTINHQVDTLKGVPHTIWFTNHAGSPSLADGSSNTFALGINNISTTEYRIANQDNINALGWVSVQADEASETFNVTMTSHDDLPTILTSVEVVFEHITTGARLSGNVTLQPAD